MAQRLTKKGIRIIKEAFELEKINPYGVGYNLYCITNHIEKSLKYQKSMDASHIGSTLDVMWAIEEMIKRKLF